MFGVSVNLINNYSVYNIQTNRGRGHHKDVVRLYSTLASKVFSSEDKAIRWIITTIVSELNEYSSAIPFEFNCDMSSYSDAWADKKERFIERIMFNISLMYLTLDNVIKLFNEHWKSEVSVDNYDFYESKIIKFEVEIE